MDRRRSRTDRQSYHPLTGKLNSGEAGLNGGGENFIAGKRPRNQPTRAIHPRIQCCRLLISASLCWLPLTHGKCVITAACLKYRGPSVASRSPPGRGSRMKIQFMAEATWSSRSFRVVSAYPNTNDTRFPSLLRFHARLSGILTPLKLRL
jgi:hypothetical protein